MKSDLEGLQEISSGAMLKALIRENFILKAQLGLLHDTLIDKGIIEEDELQLKLSQYMLNMDEREFKRYLIETAQLIESMESNKARN